MHISPLICLPSTTRTIVDHHQLPNPTLADSSMPRDGKSKAKDSEPAPAPAAEIQTKLEETEARCRAALDECAEIRAQCAELAKVEVHHRNYATMVSSHVAKKAREDVRETFQRNREQVRKDRIANDRLMAQNELILLQGESIEAQQRAIRTLRGSVDELSAAPPSQLTSDGVTISILQKKLQAHLARDASVSARHAKLTELLSTYTNTTVVPAPLSIPTRKVVPLQKRRHCVVISAGCVEGLPSLNTHHDALAISDLLRACGNSVDVFASKWDTVEHDALFVSTKVNLMRVIASLGLAGQREEEVTVIMLCYSIRHAEHGLLLLPTDARLGSALTATRKDAPATFEVTEDMNLIAVDELLRCLRSHHLVSSTLMLDTVSPVPSVVSPAGGVLCVLTDGASCAYEYRTSPALKGHPPRQPSGLLRIELEKMLRLSDKSTSTSDFAARLSDRPPGRRWPAGKIPLTQLAANVATSAAPPTGRPTVSLVCSEGIDPMASTGVCVASGTLKEAMPSTLCLSVGSTVMPMLLGRTDPTVKAQRCRRTFQELLLSYFDTVLADWAPQVLSTPDMHAGGARCVQALSLRTVNPVCLLGNKSTPFDEAGLIAGDVGCLEVTLRATAGKAGLLTAATPASWDPVKDLRELFGDDTFGVASPGLGSSSSEASSGTRRDKRWLVWGYYEERSEGEPVLVTVYTERPKVSSTVDGWLARGVIQVTCPSIVELALARYAALSSLGGKALMSLHQGVEVCVTVSRDAHDALQTCARVACGRTWDTTVSKAQLQLASRVAHPYTLHSILRPPDASSFVLECVRKADGSAQAIVDMTRHEEDARCVYTLDDGDKVDENAVEICESEDWLKTLAAFADLQKIKHERDIEEPVVLRSVCQDRYLLPLSLMPSAESRRISASADFVVLFLLSSRSTPVNTALTRCRAVAHSFIASSLHVSQLDATGFAFLYHVVDSTEHDSSTNVDAAASIDFGLSANPSVSNHIRGSKGSSVVVCCHIFVHAFVHTHCSDFGQGFQKGLRDAPWCSLSEPLRNLQGR